MFSLFILCFLTRRPCFVSPIFFLSIFLAIISLLPTPPLLWPIGVACSDSCLCCCTWRRDLCHFFFFFFFFFFFSCVCTVCERTCVCVRANHEEGVGLEWSSCSRPGTIILLLLFFLSFSVFFVVLRFVTISYLHWGNIEQGTMLEYTGPCWRRRVPFGARPHFITVTSIHLFFIGSFFLFVNSCSPTISPRCALMFTVCDHIACHLYPIIFVSRPFPGKKGKRCVG